MAPTAATAAEAARALQRAYELQDEGDLDHWMAVLAAVEDPDLLDDAPELPRRPSRSSTA